MISWSHNMLWKQKKFLTHCKDIIRCPRCSIGCHPLWWAKRDKMINCQVWRPFSSAASGGSGPIIWLLSRIWTQRWVTCCQEDKRCVTLLDLYSNFSGRTALPTEHFWSLSTKSSPSSLKNERALQKTHTCHANTECTFLFYSGNQLLFLKLYCLWEQYHCLCRNVFSFMRTVSYLPLFCPKKTDNKSNIVQL